MGARDGRWGWGWVWGWGWGWGADDLAIVVHAFPPPLYGDVGAALLGDVDHGLEGAQGFG